MGGETPEDFVGEGGVSQSAPEGRRCGKLLQDGFCPLYLKHPFVADNRSSLGTLIMGGVNTIKVVNGCSRVIVFLEKGRFK